MEWCHKKYITAIDGSHWREVTTRRVIVCGYSTLDNTTESNLETDSSNIGVLGTQQIRHWCFPNQPMTLFLKTAMITDNHSELLYSQSVLMLFVGILIFLRNINMKTLILWHQLCLGVRRLPPNACSDQRILSKRIKAISVKLL